MKRLSILVLLVCLGTGATACDITASAATVGGATVTTSQLNAQLTQIINNQYAQCTLQLEGMTLPTPLAGVGQNTVNSSFAAGQLASLVLDQLVQQDLARLHKTIANADLTAARADLVAELASSNSQSPCPNQLAGALLVQQLPAAFLQSQVRSLAAQELLAATLGHVDLSQAALTKYYDANPDQFHEICLSDIALGTQAQAQSVRSAIASGSQTFAQAAQQSLDTQSSANGGVLGCAPLSQIQNQLILGAVNNLPQGQVSQPVYEPPTGSGGGVWFLLKVDSRPQVPFDQAAPQIRLELLAAQRAVVSSEFSRIIHAAHVVIDPRYGSWSTVQGVIPPLTLPAKDLLSPAANQASGSVLGTTSPAA